MNTHLGFLPDQSVRHKAMPSVPPEPVLSVDSVASILHELRNPLAVVIAQAETLTEGICGPLTQPQMEAVCSIRDQVHQALRLLTDLALAWSDPATLSDKSDAPSKHGTSNLFQQALKDNAGTLESRDVTVHLVPGTSDLVWAGDAHLMQRFVSELVACTLQLCPKGARLRLGHAADSVGTFIGFLGDSQAAPAADSPLTASVLTQLERIKPIGLRLLQRGTSALGGVLVAHTTSAGHPALGIALPPCTRSDHSEPEPPALEAAEAIDRPHVLIADDQVLLTDVVKNYLEELGLRVLVAGDGHEAVRLALTQRPKLILMDVRMPVLDGLQALAQIRAADDPLLAGTPVFCMSGNPAPSEEARCLDAGADRFIIKPFSLDQLHEFARMVAP